jgi:hypothetical protein
MIWIIEESPNPGIWNILQSRGMYKNKDRADRVAKELQRWHIENIQPDNPNFGMRYRAVAYGSFKVSDPQGEKP